MNKEMLINAGIDYNDGLRRFVDNVALYEKFLEKFLEDNNYHNAIEAHLKKDYTNEIMYIHTLKGVTGNLSITPLYVLTTKINQILKEEKYEEADKLIPQLIETYERIIEVIKKSK